MDAVVVHISETPKIVPKPPRVLTTVWIAETNDAPQMFFCHRCQSPEFSYKGNVVMMIDGDGAKELKFPITMKCRNKNCRQFYTFVWLEPEVV